MDTPSTYADLSLITEKAIDIAYFVNKIKGNGYSIVALDQEVTDPKQIVTILLARKPKPKN